ncbi:MAG: sigma-54 dependent transcriptional regulator [Calditrichia bacterium]
MDVKRDQYSGSLTTHEYLSTLKVLFVGSGRSTYELIKLLFQDPTIVVSGIVGTNPHPEVLAFTQSQNIPIYNQFEQVIRDETLDVIFNVGGNAEVQQQISRDKNSSTVLIGKKSVELLLSAWSETEQQQLLESLLQPARRDMLESGESSFIIGKTEKMQEISNMINQVAPTPTTVLIRGESGTGKELVAKMIHQRSPWRVRPLITVNCTAFSATLIESELFGYKKGAFTGANSDRTGLLELANNGSIFLDEIGDMPVEMQSKLLRFLQSGEIRRVGDYETRKVRVRIIAATNRDLEEAMRRGEFRQDLFYRLNAFTIYSPALRERREDIPDLVSHFLKIVSDKVNKRVTRISTAAMAAICDYQWPGNIRELKNVMERAVVMTQNDEIDTLHLPHDITGANDSAVQLNAIDLNEGLMLLKSQMIDRFEYEVICRYLKANEGNISRAAENAKVPRRTFQRLVSKHNISTDDFKHRNGTL